jgi:16S rRNA processing protein RimM
MAVEKESIAIAVVGRSRGLRGEVRLTAFGTTLSRLKLPVSLLVGPSPERTEALTLVAMTPTKGGWFATFERIGDREAAERLLNLTAYLPRDRLPPLPAGEHYHWELEGLRVVTHDGERMLGTVSQVHNYPTVDAVEVVSEDRPQWVLPLREETVAAIDVAGGVIRVREEALTELF